jgi:AraC family transcriptional regulator
MEVMSIDAELRVSIARIQLARYHLEGPSEHTLCDEGAWWLDLCLTPRPRNTRARFHDRWAADRFERIGGLYMLPAGQVLQVKSDGGGRQASIVCLLLPEPLRKWFEDDFEWTDRRLEANLDVSNTNVRGLMLRLGREIHTPGFAGGMLAELIAAQLAIELRRHCGEAPGTAGLAPWRLRLIDERLAEVSDPPSLTELADLCQLSVRQLARGFRTSRGCSIGEFVAQRRIELAKRRLATDESVKSIALSMGFTSVPSFTRAFRRDVGMPPSQFRARRLEASA